ncbi:hypothetical protein ACLKA7_008397 [Drosophila subpalustris]
MSQLVICRTCGKKIYNSNAKNLFDTEDNEILAKIHILTGIYINEEQHLPKDICGSCHLDLNHSIAFRERCIKTHKLLLMLNERRRKRANLNALKTAKIKSKKHPQLEIVRVSIEPYHPLIEKKAKKIHTYSKNHIRKSTISEELPSIDQQPNTFCKEESQHDECPKFERSVHLDNDEFSKLTESQAFCEASQNESHIIEHTADSDNEIPDKPKKNPDHRGSKPVATGAKKYVCHHCGRCFADSSNFKVHILRHTGIKDFKCTECGAKFFTRHLLHLHTRVRHLGEKPYAFDADKSLPVRNSRGISEVSVQTHQKTRSSISSDSLSDEMKLSQVHCRLSGKKIRKLRSYFCDQCGRHFNDKANLNRHLQRHLGVKSFECQECGHKDYSQHLINLHTRIQHQGEKPYACKHCGNRFSNSMARLRHQRGHVEYLAPQVEMPSFTCNLCNKSFTKKTTLDNHAVVHTGEQPFCCETCNVYFNRKSSLRTHYRSKAHQNKATLKLDELGTDSN